MLATHPEPSVRYYLLLVTGGAMKESERNATSIEIDQQVYDLYDEYCHGNFDRREFLRRVALITVVGGSALVMAQALLPHYARAQTISFTDKRIRATYVTYPSKGGNSGKMRGYLVEPVGTGPYPAVMVVHENRGLNPYIEDVARRLATKGFLALAPDGLSPVGGYPGNDDDGKKLQRSLDQKKLKIDLYNSALYVKNHRLSTKRLGVTGFCFGGGIVNHLAAVMGSDLHAGAPYYGRAADSEDVAKIKAPLAIHLAAKDDRVNAGYPDYEMALKKAKVDYTIYRYADTQHGFHNNSTPRYNKKAAELSWSRTLAHFRKHL